jgi:hypothetical protein
MLKGIVPRKSDEKNCDLVSENLKNLRLRSQFKISCPNYLLKAHSKPFVLNHICGRRAG